VKAELSQVLRKDSFDILPFMNGGDSYPPSVLGIAAGLVLLTAMTFGSDGNLSSPMSGSVCHRSGFGQVVNITLPCAHGELKPPEVAGTGS